MKKYTEYQKEYIGGSNVKSLTITGMREGGLYGQIIQFRENGTYEAYITDENVAIEPNFALVGTFSEWVYIYSDDARIERITADTITIYQADTGDYIIKLTNQTNP